MHLIDQVATEKYPACSLCQKRDPLPGIDPTKPPPKTPHHKDEAELAIYNIQGSREVIHRTDASGLVATYEMPHDIACSMKGDHRHKLGVVLATRCGIKVRMGYDCGKKYVTNFSEIVKEKKRRTDYHSLRASMLRELNELPHRLSAMDIVVNACARFKDAIACRVPEFAEKMIGLLEDKKTFKIETVPGIELWEPREPVPGHWETIQRVKAAVEKWGKNPPNDDEAKIQKHLISLVRSYVEDTESWARQARRFFTLAALQDAIKKSNTRKELAAREGGLWLRQKRVLIVPGGVLPLN